VRRRSLAKDEPSNRRLRKLIVTAISKRSSHGRIIAGSLTIPCAVGRAGLKPTKREGDGATPTGRYRLMQGFWRADRAPRALYAGGLTMLTQRLGWCDDAAKPNYNRLIRLPSSVKHECLWRQDELYDFLIVLDYNLNPRIAGRGSAIFLHVARNGLAPTRGCIAVARQDMRRLLPRLCRRSLMDIL
jgi:L,D-peptidoglycan transpeptidase YkuD (ErfK/YbiS/YcfS/YnhG family)